jgi:uncharacterized protein (DUF2141 family)
MLRSLCLVSMLAVVLTANAFAQSVALTGSLRTSNGPVAGATIYVTQRKDPNGNAVNGSRVGPVVTSGAGTFTFYNLAAGQYSLSVSIAQTTVWQGTVVVPGRLSPILLH